MKRYLRATFASLGGRNYRLYFFGQSMSQIGTWTQKITQAWLVLELTDSGTLLGITLALQALPTLLFTAWGGLLADRLDKRRLLLCTQAASIAPATALGILTATGTATLWIVFVMAVIIGIIEALDKPARQTFIAEVVPRETLTNALTLNNITINSGKLIGPAIAGVLITGVGMAASFFVNAASFCVVLLALFLVRTDQLHQVTRIDRSKGQLREGLIYVVNQPRLLGPLLLLTVTGLIAWEWTVTLPLYAREVLHGDAQVVSALFIAMGAGAIIGVLAIAGILQATPGRLILASLIFAALLFAISLVPTLIPALILLFLLGAAGVAYRVITTSMAQLEADPIMRGRTMALFVIAIGGTSPVSAPLLGWLCEVLGVTATLMIGAVGCAVMSVAIWVYMRSRPKTAASPPHAASEVIDSAT
ncbi:Predicted arabinose efflux permease, MFS family [Arthrobacter sp. cf158]|uniref:MFS transporter n=1 Tax=Arthrobacter sp. cf158 TaxID=1761744 RepID=UPI00089497F8|nr:MFS transporter [Arthrobacter sp. cf158]SDW60602.1 Predicted arabinose efflux permease, MFS family [Arthrobacter sp. cf158]